MSGDGKTFIPIGKLPDTPFAGTKEQHWVACDDAGAYRRRGGDPRWGEEDIVYRFNDQGYRAPSLSDVPPNALRVLSIGCSNTFGVGLPEEAIFHNRVTQWLGSHLTCPIVNWNLGLPGASNEYILRMLLLAEPLLAPDLVLINFTLASRRDYFTVDGRWMPYRPQQEEPEDLVLRECFRHFLELSSTPDDMVNLFRCYKSAAAVLRSSCWLYSFCLKADLELIEPHLDHARCAGYLEHWPKIIDLARDHAHVGPKTHQLLADSYVQKLERLGYPALLSQRLAERRLR